MKKLFIILLLLWAGVAYGASTTLSGTGSTRLSGTGSTGFVASGGGNTVSYESTTNAAKTDGHDLVITKPSGAVEGDIIIASILDDYDVDLTANGFTSLESVTSSSSRTSLLYRVVESSDGASYTFTSDSNHKTGVLVRYSKSGGTWTVSTHNSVAASGSSITSTSITGIAGCIAHFAICSDDAVSVSSVTNSVVATGDSLTSSAYSSAYRKSIGAESLSTTATMSGSGDLAIAVVIVGSE